MNNRGEMKQNREELEGKNESPLLGIQENTETVVFQPSIKLLHFYETRLRHSNRYRKIYAPVCSSPTYSSLQTN